MLAKAVTTAPPIKIGLCNIEVLSKSKAPLIFVMSAGIVKNGTIAVLAESIVVINVCIPIGNPLTLFSTSAKPLASTFRAGSSMLPVVICTASIALISSAFVFAKEAFCISCISAAAPSLDFSKPSIVDIASPPSSMSFAIAPPAVSPKIAMLSVTPMFFSLSVFIISAKLRV